MADFNAIAHALASLGFEVCQRHTDKIKPNHRTAWEGKFTVRGAIALLVQLGLTRDPQRFNGHTCLWTDDHSLVTIWQEHGKVVIVYTQT